MNVVFNKQNSRDVVLDFLLNHRKHFLFGVLFLAVTFGGYFFWKWRSDSINRKATLDLQKILLTKKTAFSSNSDDLKNNLLEEAQSFFLKHKSSAVAPLFLLLKASVLEDKKEFLKEIEVLSLAEKMLDDEVFGLLVKIKRLSLALLQYEEKDETIAALDALTQSANDIAQQLSLRVLFIYFWNAKNFARARVYGERLLRLQENLDMNNKGFLSDLFEKCFLIISS